MPCNKNPPSTDSSISLWTSGQVHNRCHPHNSSLSTTHPLSSSHCVSQRSSFSNPSHSSPHPSTCAAKTPRRAPERFEVKIHSKCRASTSRAWPNYDLKCLRKKFQTPATSEWLTRYLVYYACSPSGRSMFFVQDTTLQQSTPVHPSAPPPVKSDKDSNLAADTIDLF
jgi:hypothetical protein